MNPSPVPENQKHKQKTALIILLCVLFMLIIIGFIYVKHLVNDGIGIVPTDTVSQVQNEIKPIVPDSQKTTSLLFFGDMMFDRGVRSQIKKIGYEDVYGDFLKDISSKYDYTIANLEGPITTYPSKLIGTDGRGIPGFTFTFPTSTAQDLRTSGVDLVSLANNHTENFGNEGLVQTAKWLKLADLPSFGNPTNNPSTEDTNPNLMTKTICNTICISYIGYHEFTLENQGSVVTEIKRVRPTSDIIIVMPHWGIEYDHLPNSKQKNLAHQWLDAGADAIIGGHPHVIQSFEMYKDKPIFYSLGNFLFDQYFSYHTTHSLGVVLNYSGTHQNHDTKLTRIDLLPIDNTDIKTKLTNTTDTNIMLTKLADISKGLVATSTVSEIKNGSITF